jgi:hypothetical protein
MEHSIPFLARVIGMFADYIFANSTEHFYIRFSATMSQMKYALAQLFECKLHFHGL